MNVDGVARRTIWAEPGGASVGIIDQTALPHRFVVRHWTTLADAAEGIRSMQVRGAPLIGVAAAYGVALALRTDPSDAGLAVACRTLAATRPTAVNLQWALDEMRRAVEPLAVDERAATSWLRAATIAEDDIAICQAMGEAGAALIEAVAKKKNGAPVNILTHCNAGWLAAVDWGTALGPIFTAQQRDVPMHIWVDETRPRSQGGLTAWELGQQGIPHTYIPDNTGGLLMRRGEVDLVIVGTDRVAANGDVCNKIGTYLKALAAHDNHVPFYVAMPSPTLDLTLPHGDAIPIEQRAASEVETVTGVTATGDIETVRVVPDGTPVANHAFDVTPARLVTALITDRGVIPATTEALAKTFGVPAREKAA